MVTTTTKTLNYSKVSGNATNSINATINSTPGFNGSWFAKIPAILKLLELAMVIVCIALIASLRQEATFVPVVNTTTVANNGAINGVNQNGLTNVNQNGITSVNNNGVVTNQNGVTSAQQNAAVVVPGLYSYMREMYLVGEVYFLCAHTWALGALMTIILSYAFHTVSSVIVPKASTVENWMNILLALALLTAGIVELIETEQWKYHNYNNAAGQSVQVWTMGSSEYGQRIAAGIISLITGVLFLVSFGLSYKELSGPAKDH